MIDLKEQSQRPYDFATKETLEKIERDPILIWAESKKLNTQHQESVWAIRKAVNYLQADVQMVVIDYMTMDNPTSRSYDNNENEPKEVARYIEWSDIIKKRLGIRKLRMVLGCIMSGEECRWETFEIAIKEY